jgi:hypothetical protein
VSENEQVQGEKEVQKYFLDNGQECSRSAYIRQEFLKGRSRGDIAKELGIPYGLVYTATANMTNEAHPGGPGVGRVGNRGTIMEDGTSRAEWLRQQVAAGRSRGDLAKELGIPYATVYAATKEIKVDSANEGHRGRVVMENGMGRAEYIRQEFQKGRSRRDIANELHCDYAVVWAATKSLKKGEDGQQASEQNLAEQNENIMPPVAEEVDGNVQENLEYDD